MQAVLFSLASYKIPRKTKRWAGSAGAALLLMLAFGGGAQAAEPQCTFPAKILDMGHRLHRTWAAISTARPLSLVALGSSSTARRGCEHSKGELSGPPARAVVVAPRTPCHCREPRQKWRPRRGHAAPAGDGGHS
jgi:hypothetical protein